jgi:methanogenic corrinoid protein MtbC1
MKMADFNKLRTAMGDLEEDKVIAVLDEIMADGGKGAREALTACQEGLAVVGKRFEEGEFFVSDLIYSGDIMAGAVDKLRPARVSANAAKAGKMLLCTVHGDLHDIGKNIVKAFFEASGFDILDLGIDTPVDKIVSTAKEQGIKLIGLSGVLTLAIDSMKDTVDGFKAAGIRDDVKIIIGGNCVTADVCKSVGADAWATSPQAASVTCLEWLKA